MDNVMRHGRDDNARFSRHSDYGGGIAKGFLMIPAVPQRSKEIIRSTSPKLITVGSITVRPDDWVIADGSGVVFLGQENVDAILSQAEQLAAREELLLKDIEAGIIPVSKVMTRTYEHMTQKDK
jgi:regulator of RNase E activity RraA